jgi:hypothetical protein
MPPILICNAAFDFDMPTKSHCYANLLFLLARLFLLPNTSVSIVPLPASHHKSMSRIHTCLFSVIDSHEA